MKLQKFDCNIPAGPSPQLKPSKEELTQLPADGEVAPELITKKALAKRYSVSSRTVQNWVTRRIVPFIRVPVVRRALPVLTSEPKPVVRRALPVEVRRAQLVRATNSR